VIATQTRAEVLVGVLSSNWGPVRQLDVGRQLDDTPTVPVNNDVVERFAEIRARAAGLAIGDSSHTGDRWVAATAVAIEAPLLAIDRIYRDCPGLELLDKADHG
jgi:predicted nucleic acid-binding protein